MKINKKKTLAVTGVFAVAALAGVIGTMSYFTDTAKTTNTFTVGNVDIALIEKQRAVDTNGCKDASLTLEDFTAQVLYPIVGSAQAKKDNLAMPVDCDSKATIDLNKPLAKNYADKMVSVENTGNGNAWVRVYYAVPTALVDSNPGDDVQTNNTIHFNEGTFPSSTESRGYYWSGVYPHDGTVTSETAHGATWLLGPVENDVVTSLYHYTTTINNISYEVYYQDTINPLAAGATSDRVLNGFYLDSGATIKNVDTASGVEQHIFDKLGNDTGWKAGDQIDIPVYAVAVQDKGFNSTAEAINTAFGANFDPFNAN